MKSIIVATDFSKEAKNATDYAASVASYIKAKLILFNSFVLPLHAGNTLLPASEVQVMIDSNIAALRSIASDIKETYGIEVEVESKFSILEDELSDVVKKYNAELVVMGMAKKSFEQDLFGNTTTNLIQSQKFPVLAIPAGVRFQGIRRILFACDTLRGVHQTILDKVKEAAITLNAQVEVFHVEDRLREQEGSEILSGENSIISERLHGVDHQHKNVYSNLVIDEIEKEIRVFNPDLLIMVPYKYGFWDSLIHRSKTRVMASGSEVPLLSIPL